MKKYYKQNYLKENNTRKNKITENKTEIELLIEKQMSDFTKHIMTEYILK